MTTRGAATAAVTGIAAAIGVGCAAGAESDSAPPATAAGVSDPAAAPLLDCASSYGRPRLTDSRRLDVVAGPARFVSVRVVARQPRRWMLPTDGRDFVRKIPLVIARGATVRIEVPPRDREHVSLVYTRAAERADRVSGGDAALEFQPCDQAGGSWWSGGVRVDGPRCVRLDVVREGSRDSVRLPFGRGTCGDAPARS